MSYETRVIRLALTIEASNAVANHGLLKAVLQCVRKALHVPEPSAGFSGPFNVTAAVDAGLCDPPLCGSHSKNPRARIITCVVDLTVVFDNNSFPSYRDDDTKDDSVCGYVRLQLASRAKIRVPEGDPFCSHGPFWCTGAEILSSRVVPRAAKRVTGGKL